ncbi:MAG TPA: D-2-hydroxyacid dehydrogenase [Ktedonobacterales bacterium]|nr:D-2-hydroxyacid dehydrogenase [Ktedonobacterales bacterium]
MENPQLVVSNFTFAPEDQRRMEAALGPGALVLAHGGRDVLREALVAHPEADVVASFFPPVDLLAIAPNLKWIALPSAGADHAIRAGIVQPGGPVVTTASGIHAVPIGEFALSLMLMWVRHWPQIIDYQRAGTWPDSAGRERLHGRELDGATLGVVGLGSIGRHIARLGRAFGMRIIATRRSASAGAGDPDVDMMVPPDRLGDLLAAADFVVVSVPATEQTRHLIGADELRAMRHAAFLINISRGSAIDEAALIAALTDGVIGGAGLDVFETEPLPAESPLWQLPNVTISPHVAGNTDQYSRRFTDLFLENLARYRAREPLRNVVDLERGY